MASRIRRDGGPWELLYSPKVDPPPVRRCPSCGRRCVASLKHVPLCHKCPMPREERLVLLGFKSPEVLRARYHERNTPMVAATERAQQALLSLKALAATAESSAPLPQSLQTLVTRDTAESTTP